MPHLVITIVLLIAQVLLPKRLAFIPLLIAALHTSKLAVIPSFSTVRLIIIVGLARAASSGELKFSAQYKIDSLMLAFASSFLLTSLFHEPTVSVTNPLIARIRFIIDIVGTYMYSKAYLKRNEDYLLLARVLAFALLPLAVIMFLSTKTGKNPYMIVGGVSDVLVRGGRMRAAGPFGTPILAGTIGALMIPFFTMIWSFYKKTALLGFFCSAMIIFSSGSSTPIGSALIVTVCLGFWFLRKHIVLIKQGVILLIVTLMIVMDRPIWHLLAMTDFTGSSTGWHRAHLIDMAFEHFNEWWLHGTIYTRHWMPYGLTTIPEHCDLTNYYIELGVTGGILPPVILLLIFIVSFRILAKSYTVDKEKSSHEKFVIWCLLSLVTAHAIVCMTISYFDQTFVFLYILIGLIANFPQAAETQLLCTESA